MVQTAAGQMIVTTTVECDLAVTVPTGKKPSVGGDVSRLIVVVDGRGAAISMHPLR